MADDRPNILIIHADQHRADCLGAAGNPDIHTPNLDALAADGVLYDRSYCSYPVCTPSRYSFLSGLYVHQHGGWSNRCTLAPGHATFPKLLRDKGFRTAAVGKMHFTPTYLDVGFQTMRLAEQDGNGRFDDDYHRYLREHGCVDAIDGVDQRWEFRQQAPDRYWQSFGALESDLPEEHHSTSWIGRETLARLAGWEGGGNLLMAGFIKPHHPFDPPAPWSTMYDPDSLNLLPGWLESRPAHDRDIRGYFDNDTLTERQLRTITAMYYATISHLDEQVGRMVELLKQKGLYDRTLIVYTSDHGDFMGYHHMVLKGNYMYEPLARVPLIIKWPQSRDAGSHSSDLVSNIDLAPTFLREAGCDVPEHWPGRALQDAAPPAYIFAEQGFADGVGYLVCSRHYKYLVAGGGERELFFDLSDDPHEQENRVADPALAAVVQAHRQALVTWRLYGSNTPVYLDTQAPLCGGDNVQTGEPDARADMHAYITRNTQAWLDAEAPAD